MKKASESPHGQGSPDETFVTLREGENYWREDSAERGAFIVDGQSYFRSVRQAMLQAERYVCILAWDLKGGIELLRGELAEDGFPTKLNDFIYSLLDQKPGLEIHILLWDYSLVYLGERDWLPFTRFRQEPHPRLHLVTDSEINIGASHHQKVVVVDGGFALCGGLDLSAWRWDTKAHAPRDERRVTADGEHFQPYHDIHMAVTGAAARALDELCRKRWERATKETAPWGEAALVNKVWPSCLALDFENTKAVFALTYSEYKEYPAITQIEELHLDVLAAAEHYIYIENQYLSSYPIANALIQRLGEPDGPEITIILTQKTGGLFEEGTLGLIRDRLLEKLVAADVHGRLGAFYPHVADNSGNESQVYVHAKALICDDRVVMVGSANLSNRSMKVDSEVMLALGLDEATPMAPGLLRRLLAVHLAKSEDEIQSSLEATESINKTIRQLREGNLHKLRDLDCKRLGLVWRKLADSKLLDPDEPVSLGYWWRKSVSSEGESSPSSHWIRYAKIAVGIVVVLLIGYGLNEAWGDLIDKDSVETFFQKLDQSPWEFPLFLGSFIVAGLTGISINVLLVAATLVIGPWMGFVYGFSGSLLSALAGFGLGQSVGQPTLERFFQSYIRQLKRKIRDRGVISIALLRLLPIAPFVVVNLAAGISGMKLRTFVAGSCLGMLPGMLGVVFVTHQARNAYTDPSWQTALYLVLGVVALSCLYFGVRKYFK